MRAVRDLARKRLSLAPDYAVLNSVPGIGEILSTVIMLETGPIERFTSAGNYASYARCVGSKRVSNSKKKGEGNRQNGNAYLVEAAHFALRYCEPAKRFYERKKARTNATVATKALAHKLARACYHMLKEHTTFNVTRCFA
jgi:transposase